MHPIVRKLVMKWNLIERAFNAGGIFVGVCIAVAVGIGTMIYKRFLE
jgi:hypothetical protein